MECSYQLTLFIHVAHCSTYHRYMDGHLVERAIAFDDQTSRVVIRYTDSDGSQVTRTWTTPGTYTFMAPEGVLQILSEAVGARGGRGGAGAPGQLGEEVLSFDDVTPGKAYPITVGANGKDAAQFKTT